MIYYRQSPPALWLSDQQRVDSAGVYSGHAEGLNNPALEAVRCVGPIPRGLWEIRCWVDKYPGKGPCVAILRPKGWNAHGRAGFLIHGDSAAMNHTASLGCIIAPRSTRQWLRDSGERELTVI